MPQRPLISLVVDASALTAASARLFLQSLRAQVYPDWDLWIVCDDPAYDEVAALVADDSELAGSKVHVLRARPGESAVAASNDSLRQASGELLVFDDRCSELRPAALLEVARKAASLAAPSLHEGLAAVRREDALAVGGLDPAYGPLASDELLLRLEERSGGTARLVDFLLRSESTAEAEPALGELWAKAVSGRLERLGAPVYAVPDEQRPSLLRLRPARELDPSGVALVLTDEGGSAAAAERTLAWLAPSSGRLAEVVVWKPSAADPQLEPPFPVRLEHGSLASAVETIDADFVLLLEAGALLEGEDWLTQLLLYAQLDGVGTVSPDFVSPHPVSPDPVPDPAASSLLVSRRHLDRLGGLLPCFETARCALIDLSLTAAAAGLANVALTAVRSHGSTGSANRSPLDESLLRDRWGDEVDLGRSDGGAATPASPPVRI